MVPYRSVHQEALAGGDAGVHQTVQRMRSLVDAAKTLPETRAVVLAALRGIREKDTLGEVTALYEWVRDHVRFIRDPVGVEYLQTPAYMLRQIAQEGMAAGDCDDASTLFAALAETAGYRTKFRMQAPPGTTFKHVLVDVQIKGGWVSFDPSQRHHGPGWRPTVLVEREHVEGLGMHDEDEPMEYEVQYEGDGLGQVATALRRHPFFSTFCPPEARGDMLIGRPVPPQPPPEKIPPRWRHYGKIGAKLRQRAGARVLPMGLSAWDENGLGQEATAPAQPSGWLAQITGAVEQVATSAIPLLERYGVLRPRVYTPTGGKVYTPPVPVGGAPGAAFQAMTSPLAFGLTGTQIMLLGGAALALMMFLPRGRSRR